MTHIHEPIDRNILQAMSVLNLAHVGDGVYELLVRTHLARQGAQKLADQHKSTIAFVAAPAQALAMEGLVPHLTEQELKIYRRGRNTRVHGCPSGCTMAQYHGATALEALFGYLWLTGQAERVETLFELILEEHYAS
jgi:ribonuclease-3 family protein